MKTGVIEYRHGSKNKTIRFKGFFSMCFAYLEARISAPDNIFIHYDKTSK